MTEPKRRKIVQSDAREIIASVYHYLKKELEVTLFRNPQGCDFSHLRNIRQRTADATGSSVRTVTRVLREERMLAAGARFPSPRRGRPRRAPDHDEHAYNTQVERAIQTYVDTNGEPDLRVLKSVLSEKIGYKGSLRTLRKTVLDLGYEIDNNSKIVATTWIVVKEEHVSDQEDVSIDMKSPFDWSVSTCNPGEPASADAAQEVPIVRIKSEPEPDVYPGEVVEVQVKQESDSPS